MDAYLREIARFDTAAYPIENGDGGYLDDKQLDLLSQMRDKVDQIVAEEERESINPRSLPLQDHHNNRFLARFLIAQDFDIEKAIVMLKKHFAWRRANKADVPLDELMSSVSENAKRFAPPPVFKYETADGYPIAWDMPGRFDIQGVVRACSQKDIVRYHAVAFMEHVYDVLRQQCQKHDKLIDKFVVIQDLEGWSTRDLAGPFVSTMKKMTQVRTDNYPQVLKTMVVVHPPAIIGMCWTLIKPFMRERTRRKVNIVRGKPERALRDVVPAQYLPKRYGGEAEDPEQPCEKVSESDYLKNAADAANLSQVTVGRGRKHMVEVEVDQAGKTISWQFQTEHKDIAFALVYFPPGTPPKDPSQGEEVLATERVSCHLAPETGQHECEKPGIYGLVLDNSFSYITSKTVQYDFSVVD